MLLIVQTVVQLQFVINALMAIILQVINQAVQLFVIIHVLHAVPQIQAHAQLVMQDLNLTQPIHHAFHL